MNRVAEDVDIQGWVASFTDDGTFTDESIRVVYRGPDELGKTVENYAKAFPDMHREIYRMYDSGDNIVVAGSWPSSNLISARSACRAGSSRRRPASGWTRRAATSLNSPAIR